MNERQKVYTYTSITNLIFDDPLIKTFVTEPIRNLLVKGNDDLNDLSLLKCLQELSRVAHDKEKVKGIIEEVSQISFILCIQGPTQCYLLYDSQIEEICNNHTKKIDLIRSLAQTKILDDHEVPQVIYDNFLAMIDSLSVYPRENFLTSWQKILNYYKNHFPFRKFPDDIQKGLLDLIKCYECLKEWEHLRLNKSHKETSQKS